MELFTIINAMMVTFLMETDAVPCANLSLILTARQHYQLYV